MKFTVEALTNAPVILTAWYEDFDMMKDEPDVRKELMRHFDSLTAPKFLVADIRRADIPLDGLMFALNAVARGDDALFHHKNVKQVIWVTTDKMMELSAAGLKHDIFGNVKISVFSDLDEALRVTESV